MDTSEISSNGWGCEKRYIGCHAECPEYIAEKALAEEEKAKRRKIKQVEDDFNSFRISGVRKAKKKDRR